MAIKEPFVFFADDESLLDSPRMSKLAQLIKENGIQKKYFLYARSDTVSRNPELLRIWRDIGLERVFIGIESFQEEDLLYIQKKSTTSENSRAVKILHDLGISVNASFIIRPEYTKDDFRSLRQYCRDLDLSYASIAVLTPLPGTDLYQEVKNQILTQNYNYFDFIHTLLPTTLPLKQFYAEYRDLFIRGISMRNHLKFLGHFPPREWVGLLLQAQKFYRRLELAYRDYEI
jgi:radical SAM superfamily enzyme YgiQ (UPF0313 family)